MKFSEWLDQKEGRTTEVARYFKRTTSAVSQWRTNGVPRRLMRAMREYSKGRVSYEGMLPSPKSSGG